MSFFSFWIWVEAGSGIVFGRECFFGVVVDGEVKGGGKVRLVLPEPRGITLGFRDENQVWMEGVSA